MTRHEITPYTEIGEKEEQASSDGKNYCAVHPNVETTLRCNRCGRYMCARCAVRTPVGYRCRQCVYQQQDAFYKATVRDYILATVAAFAISIPISFIVPRLFLIGVIFLSIPAGALIGEVAIRVSGKRRGRYYAYILIGIIILAAVLTSFPVLQSFFQQLDAIRGVGSRIAPQAQGQLVTNLFFSDLLPTLLYVVMCSVGAAGRVR